MLQYYYIYNRYYWSFIPISYTISPLKPPNMAFKQTIGLIKATPPQSFKGIK